MIDESCQEFQNLNDNHYVLDYFKYSWFFDDDGEKRLYQWARKNWRECFDPQHRLVFLQDIPDVYDYENSPGRCTYAIQQILCKIDISNCFVVILTTNTDIESELILANKLTLNSADTIGYVIVEGSYHKKDQYHSDTFCVNPWIHLYIGPEGDVLPCCTGNQKFPIGHIDKEDLDSIYNNKNFQILRQRMLNGQRTRECSHCWIKEDAGLPSPRKEANLKYGGREIANERVLIELSPRYLDVRLNKLCNLKCRSCSPYYSSAIAQEINEIYGHQWPSLNNKQRKRVLDLIVAILPGVDDIYFAGGEPLLSPEHFKILNELLSLGKTDITIFYNTNLTQLSYKGSSFVDIWKEFQNITIGASIDAYEQEAEYLRHGTVWTIIEQNIKTLVQHSPNVHLKITSTVGFLNVESLIKLQRTWSEQKLLPIERFEISQIIFDSYLSIQAAPEHHKKRLEKIIRSHMEWLSAQKAISLHDRWQQVIDYMWAEDRSHLLREFAKITLQVDRHRKECFHDIFPQFGDLIPLNDTSNQSTMLL